MAFFRSVSALSRLRSRVVTEKKRELASNLILRIQLDGSKLRAPDLYSELKELVPEYQERVKKLKKDHGSVELGKITVDMVLGGMRGMTALVWLGSAVDPDEGIRFRGMSIPECQKKLPGAFTGGEPLPEAVLWLLLTGKIPSKAQVDSLSKELRSRATIPDYAYKAIDALPVSAHPMTQFTTGVMALQVQSEFQKAYEGGIAKARKYKDGKIIPLDDSLDYGANYAHMLGFDDPEMLEFMRLYISIHSPLSDPYLAFAAALNGLAGPLHGLANQEVLRWIRSIVAEFGTPNISTEQLADYINKTLSRGQVVPGYGHGVLRQTDPRYTCQREFALKHLPNDPYFQLVKNPWPNVDAHSGVLLNYYGLTEEKYGLIWDRALGMPLERPKSVTLEKLEQLIHGCAVRNSIHLHHQLSSALIEVFERCGSLRCASLVFEKMRDEDKDVVMWSNLIPTCTFHGEAEVGLESFRWMETVEVR
ncbi:hypothetical protein JHK82_043916 [Glycine max]|nr:hypothetical protein JHK82_043916 [Glycine max]